MGVRELVSLPMSGFGLTTRPVLLLQQLGLCGMCAIHCGRPEYLILRAPLEQLVAMPTSIGYAFGHITALLSNIYEENIQSNIFIVVPIMQIFHIVNY